MGNIHMELFGIWAIGSEVDTVQIFFSYLKFWWSFCSVKLIIFNIVHL